jgi:mono/diheme cytochrome c family protein
MTTNLLKGAILLVLIAFFISCEKSDENENSGSGDRSHNAGENCMNCHKSGGSGEGRFTVAGTLYNAAGSVYPNATVKLYTGDEATGTLVKSIKSDASGNFYTTESVSFGTGLYVTINGTNGELMNKGFTISNGSCNSCHGNSTGAIEVK